MTVSSIEAITHALHSGRWKDAEAGARMRLAREDGDVEAVIVLALSLGLQGRLVEALPIYRRLTELQPHEAAHFSNLATALRDSGDLAGAEAMYRQAVGLRPADAAVLSNLGLLRWQQGDMVEARDLLLAACRADPSLPEPRIYGALACHACAEDDTARQLLAGCERWQGLGEDLEVDLAAALVQIERIDGAESRLNDILRRYPGSTKARLQLAALYERLSRVADAESLLAGVAIRGEAPSDDELSIRAALLARSTHAQEARAAYEELLQRTGDAAPNAPYYFALAKCCDRLGDAASAMHALERGHAAQLRSALRLAPELADPDSEPLAIARQRISTADRAQWQSIEAPDSADSPIFVVGFPRSGTTLLEQMLDAQPELCSMDERAFVQDVIDEMARMGFAYPVDLGRLDSAVCARLRGIYWARVATVIELGPGRQLVDKNPLNILRLPLLLRLFPRASVILALRHPMDVVLSCYMQSFRAPGFQILCSSLHRLARGYVNAMQFWLEHVDVLQPRVLELRYEDLVDNPTMHARALGDFLGLVDVSSMLKFDEHARAKGFISTPSYAQVVEPLNKKAVGRWQRYREYLEPVVPLLKPIIDHWSYSLD